MLRENEQDTPTLVYEQSDSCYCPILKKLEFSPLTSIQKTAIINFTKIRRKEVDLFHAELQISRKTNLTFRHRTSSM